MPGAMLAVGTIAASAVLAVGVGAAAAVSLASVRAASAADSAALAAADTAAGFAVGEPCARAAEIAARGGARLVACGLSGLTATVEVTVEVGVHSVGARARAGQPPAAPP
ncbi:Rv3654c family TadE-like protein [Microbacterium telephonicum]|uniref:Secretion/DNA translocation related TadE-like protein n=1 Tax=Microbacterium telephonicum TaxID=1714841 RepID=A0A498C2M4_9MICO|nr:Rv3654c family TadE-like protein [Microbacterium telephonicum]RLK47460.1 secretion/DNA translocation related TadE-like protein [Microbacterium telephonicum]